MGQAAVLASALAAAVLFSGCFLFQWQNVDPEELTVSLRPSEPVAGEPLTLVAEAPRKGNLHLIMIAFDGGGSQGTTTASSHATLTLESVVAGDLIAYGVGAYERDEDGVERVRLSPAQAVFVGPQDTPRFEVRAETSMGDDVAAVPVVVTHDGSSDARVEGWFYAKTPNSASTGTVVFQAGPEEGEHQGMLRYQDLSAGTPVAFVVRVVAEDGASYGYTTGQITVS